MSGELPREDGVEEPRRAHLENDGIGIELSWAVTYEALKKMPYEIFHFKPEEKGDWFWIIVRFIRQKFPDLPTAYEDFSKKFAKHPPHTCAMAVLKKRPDPPDTIAVMVMMIAFSHDVFQVKDVLSCIQNMPSFKPQAKELFNLLTSLFFLLWKREIIPQRIHYQMFYAMKTLEDDFLGDHFTFSAHGQLQLTNEQKRISEHKFTGRDVVIIEALAGTGKTTTLVEIVRSNPKKEFLYLTFNKSVQEEASKKFEERGVKWPAIDCRTFHSLAYHHIVHTEKYSSAKLKPAENLQRLLRKCLDQNTLDLEQFYRLIKNVSKTLSNFFTSISNEVSTGNLPTSINRDDFIGNQNLVAYKEMVLKQSQKVWQQMKDKENNRVPLIHDAYMKLYLLKMKGEQIPGFHCILVDEAQDLTPAIREVLSAQTIPKVFVGDRHQQIYRFTGAVNALDRIKSTHTYPLSQSFRFGPDIAYFASCILSTLKHVHSPTVLGTMEKDGYYGEVDETKPVAIVARNHATLFEQLVHICDTKPDAFLGFPGGLEKSQLPILEDIYRLDEGNREDIQDKTIGHYETYKDLKEFALKTEDLELYARIKIYDRFKYKIMKYMKIVREREACSLEVADFVFSTAHKIKGLEFHTVKLCDDFCKRDDQEMDDHENSDECNLLYVAATRAKQYLVLNQSLVTSILAKAKDNFLYLQPKEMGANNDCVNCERRVQDEGSLLVCVKRHSYSVWSRKEQEPTSYIYPEGMLCLDCVKKQLPHMEGLLY